MTVLYANECVKTLMTTWTVTKERPMNRSYPSSRISLSKESHECECVNT